MESPDEVIFILPLQRQPRLNLALRRNAYQPFEQIANDIKLDVAFDLMRVERSGFITVVPDKLLFCCKFGTLRDLGGHCRGGAAE